MQKMKLKNFQISNFKSISDSGIVEINDITTLVGVNESGKSNILLALWKFNPARGGDIKIYEDVPFSFSKNNIENLKFITCEFEFKDEILKSEVEISLGYTSIRKLPSTIKISKTYNGIYSIDVLENVLDFNTISKDFCEFYQSCINSMEKFPDIIEIMEDWIQKNPISQFDSISKNLLIFFNNYLDLTKSVISELDDYEEKSNAQDEISSFNNWLKNQISKIEKYFSTYELIIKSIPKFIYYSHYDSIPSTISLSETVEKIKNKKEFNNKINTIEILFKYLKLDINEILELGLPESDTNILWSYKIDERTIKLNQASFLLSEEFNKWWSQAQYDFSFKADGDLFKIWVSKKTIEQEVNLKNRSMGFQWFLSFYLIFSIGEIESNSGNILLLDEAGLSLHPQGQKDLIIFLNSISKKNQILYTTHSPFLIDTKHLENSKIVYLDKNLNTVVSDNLRANQNNLPINSSIHAIYAALELENSDILFQNPNSIVVEGLSDQYYLNAIESYLIKHGLINDNKEVSFVPSGGTGKMLVPIIHFFSKNIMPKIIIDSDDAGEKFYLKISKGDYSADLNKIIRMKDIIEKEDATIEDILPVKLFEKPLKTIFPNIEIDKIFNDKEPFVKQINEYFKKNNIKEQSYKVLLAKRVKKGLDISTERIDKKFEDVWIKLFNKIFE